MRRIEERARRIEDTLAEDSGWIVKDVADVALCAPPRAAGACAMEGRVAPAPARGRRSATSLTEACTELLTPLIGGSSREGPSEGIVRRLGAGRGARDGVGAFAAKLSREGCRRGSVEAEIRVRELWLRRTREA